MKFKNILSIFILASIIALIITKSQLKASKKTENNLSNKKSKINVIGESYDVEYIKPSFAIADAQATVPYTGEELEGYATPQTVKKLGEEIPIPRPGPLEAIDETPTIHDYYDGSLKLNVVKVNCSIYTTSSDCIQNSACGWCGSSGQCVLGTNFGPNQPCVKASYIYGKPYPNWQPQLRKINEAVGGVTQTIISDVQ